MSIFTSLFSWPARTVLLLAGYSTTLLAQTTYLGQLQLPDLPALDTNYPCLYYDGTQVIIDRVGNFSFQTDYLTQLLVLFTDHDNIQHCAEDNTVKCLQLKTANYLCFQLNLRPQGWISTPKQLALNTPLPAHTLLIALDPTDLDCQIAPSTAQPKLRYSVQLPPIILACSGLNCQKLKTRLAKSICGSLNLRPFHTTPVEHKVRYNKTVLGLKG